MQQTKLLKRTISFQEGRLTFEERKEILDKGPHNLIFHGVVPDWIETHELILDDPDFIKDVDPIGQRIRSLIREEVNAKCHSSVLCKLVKGVPNLF